jgi:hypothetical protein
MKTRAVNVFLQQRLKVSLYMMTGRAAAVPYVSLVTLVAAGEVALVGGSRTARVCGESESQQFACSCVGSE